MSHTLSSKHNTYKLLQYIHSSSEDASLFNEGISLEGLTPTLKYKANSKSSLESIKKLHILSSTGPDLVSKKLRDALQEFAPNEVEFFDAVIYFQGDENHDFCAINVINKINCCDMEKSEYEITNFDPNEPSYMFLYTVLLDKIPNNFDIIRSRERPTTIVVSDDLKAFLKDKNFNDLMLCRSIDLTPNNRSECD